MLIPHTIKQIEIICSLFDIKEGTIKDISRNCNTRREYGYIYRMMPFLIKYGILKICNRHFKCYKVNHTELGRFLFTEEDLHKCSHLIKIYDQYWNGRYIAFFKLKQKEGWDGERRT